MMTEQIEKVVGVWFDGTPEVEYRAWVVADEELFADGTTAYTHTIKTFGGDRDAAIAFAESRAKQRSVRLAIQ